MQQRFVILAVFLVAATAQDANDWTKQCNRCTCIWVNGRRTANCTNRGFGAVPEDLSTEIKEIDFSDNPLYQLGREAIVRANLKDIHKLRFQNCSIQTVDKTAFAGLGLIIELDLSRNEIKELDRSLFREAWRIRIINISYNKIKVLEDGLFYNFSYLQRISVDHNAIEAINENTFMNLTTLSHIDLAFNRLRTIAFDLKTYLPKLNSLDVQGNPWVCDCHLENFRRISIAKSLITKPTECAEPPRLKGSMWGDSITFACAPAIVEPQEGAQVQATEENVTIICKVYGDPEPDVDWTTNGRTLDVDPRRNNQKYITSKKRVGEYKWNNLTIINVNYRDRGEYKCIAKNPGGEDARNLTLIIAPGARAGGGIVAGIPGSTFLIIGLSIGLIVLLLIILVLVCCFCRKSQAGGAAKRSDMNDSSEEYVSMRGVPEIKKSLITEINPVTKPPRAGVPSSVVSGGTEVSDAKKNLLDNEFAYDDNESRSMEYEPPPTRKSQMLLDMDYRLNAGYPPDLLPYPPRAGQASPAGSNASTVADTTRLPAHHGPQSPLHSPIYDYVNFYRTLPYNRSHSPFVQPVQRVTRQGAGYMTIPRKPRQSWSSEPPPRNDDDVLDPLYDNLGVRSTLDGSSKLSLCASVDTAASTPRSNRTFPLSPTAIGPISEAHELTPPGGAAPTNRSAPATPATPIKPQWAGPDAERSGEGKPTKIPPRPPPKPKKRASAGPLFEDEGEDGTEV